MILHARINQSAGEFICFSIHAVLCIDHVWVEVGACGGVWGRVEADPRTNVSRWTVIYKAIQVCVGGCLPINPLILTHFTHLHILSVLCTPAPYTDGLSFIKNMVSAAWHTRVLDPVQCFELTNCFPLFRTLFFNELSTWHKCIQGTNSLTTPYFQTNTPPTACRDSGAELFLHRTNYHRGRSCLLHNCNIKL